MLGTGAELSARFEKDGYIIVPRLLDAGGAAHYRALLQRESAISDGDFDPTAPTRVSWDRPDGVTTTPDFWPLIFDPRLLEAVHAVIGPDARYTQHSDLHVNRGAPGWHRDSAHRRFGQGPDWDESRTPYKIARVAIYLQSYAESHSALGIIPGSHRKESLLNRAELLALSQANKLLRHRARQPLPGHFVSMRAVWIKTEPGDCVIFNQRLLHSAGRIIGPKYAIFMSYGAENEHSRRHRHYYMYERSDLNYGDYPAELADRLRDADLYLTLESAVPPGVAA
jgi:hypothetical protein